MDSRKIEKGNLFICVPGINEFLEDRHPFAKDAVKNGAVALIVEQDVDADVPKIFVNAIVFIQSSGHIAEVEKQDIYDNAKCAVEWTHITNSLCTFQTYQHKSLFDVNRK